MRSYEENFNIFRVFHIFLFSPSPFNYIFPALCRPTQPRLPTQSPVTPPPLHRVLYWFWCDPVPIKRGPWPSLPVIMVDCLVYIMICHWELPWWEKLRLQRESIINNSLSLQVARHMGRDAKKGYGLKSSPEQIEPLEFGSLIKSVCSCFFLINLSTLVCRFNKRTNLSWSILCRLKCLYEF